MIDDIILKQIVNYGVLGIWTLYLIAKEQWREKHLNKILCELNTNLKEFLNSKS